MWSPGSLVSCMPLVSDLTPDTPEGFSQASVDPLISGKTLACRRKNSLGA